MIEWLLKHLAALFTRSDAHATESLTKALDGQGRFSDRLEARLTHVESMLAAKEAEVAQCRINEIEQLAEIRRLKDQLKELGEFDHGA